MSVDVKDAARLNDIVKAREAIASFIAGQTEEEYGRNLLLRSAVERQVEIIGEATRAIFSIIQSGACRNSVGKDQRNAQYSGARLWHDQE